MFPASAISSNSKMGIFKFLIPFAIAWFSIADTRAWSAPPPSDAISLREAFAAALGKSETIASQGEAVFQANEQRRQAVGGILPTIEARATYLRQDSPDTDIGTRVTPISQPLVRLSAIQPLFRGFREFAALRRFGQLTEAQELTRSQAVLGLSVDVAESFFTVQSLEEEIRNLNAEIELYGKRSRELRERARIGRSRLSEALTVEASQSALQARLALTRGQLLQARETFAFLTGFAGDVPLKSEPPATAQGLPSLSYFISRISERPGLRALERQRNAADQNVSIARGAHLPSIDLIGNYYLIRRGASEGVQWDVQVGLTLPIFAGGIIQSQVRESSSQLRQAELALAQGRRQAEREIRSLYSSVTSGQAQLEALTRARALAERNHREVLQDYRLGLLNNIEVLQAMTALQESERAMDQQNFQLKLDEWKLYVAVGINRAEPGGIPPAVPQGERHSAVQNFSSFN